MAQWPKDWRVDVKDARVSKHSLISEGAGMESGMDATRGCRRGMPAAGRACSSGAGWASL